MSSIKGLKNANEKTATLTNLALSQRDATQNTIPTKKRTSIKS